MGKNIITLREAINFVDHLNASLLGCDVSQVIYPKKRRDICVVKKSVGKFSSYGFDLLFLLWKDGDGYIHSLEILDTRGRAGARVVVESVTVRGDKVRIVYHIKDDSGKLPSMVETVRIRGI